ncbi:DUF4190 domain-containing protein [Jiangella rhizosphaerae]|uniref:DUF4190 domain-containing protein n=1 Tax=Jiangella rhizosphaerae TaxID=2293569 RepID=A0A418KQB2_9ACTN|nr:DUF4190 domain-containing protein [Jiangella rhizosphaerae]RIQ21878.1 DUF4190 domain-containing protein [Jiangella rhizosphaerae]
MSDAGAPPPPPNPYAQPAPGTPPHQAGGGTPYPQGGTPYPHGGTAPPAYPQYGPYSPYGPNPWPGEPPRKPGTNGFAIAALVLGIVVVIPLAIVFGIIALVQTAKTGQKGRGLAIGGLVAAGLWIVLFVGLGVWAVMSEPERNEAGEITEGGTVSTFDVEVGDCLNGLRETEDETAISMLPAVPCDEPHEGEVYATFDLEDGDYPGEEAISALAGERCDAALLSYSASAYDDRNVGIFFLYPQEVGWPQDREVVCIAYAATGMLTGTLTEQTGT